MRALLPEAFVCFMHLIEVVPLLVIKQQDERVAVTALDDRAVCVGRDTDVRLAHALDGGNLFQLASERVALVGR